MLYTMRLANFLLALALVLTFALPAIARFVARRQRKLQAEYLAAFERGDVAAMRRLRERTLGRGSESPIWKKVGDAEELLIEERWAEAREVLSAIDFGELPAMSQPGVRNNLAYATALAGEPTAAVEIARLALLNAETLGPSYPKRKRTNLRGTLGIALSLAGRHDEAVATLEPLVADDGASKRALATRAFHLGASLRALGRFEDAARVLARGAAQDGPFADRSRDALAALSPHRG